MALRIDDPATATTRPELKREMGLWTATAMVVGNMIGSGVFLLPAALAAVAIVYGSSILLAWVVTGVGAMLLAGVFATMGGRYPKMGGPYAYARRAFGDFVGFQTAWGYWIAAWVGNAAIAIAFVGYTTVLWPGLAQSSLAMAGLAVAAIWLLTVVNAFGVREGGWVQVATTILKFVPLALIGVIGLFYLRADHFTPFLVAGGSTARHGLTLLQGITAAIGLTLWAFIGLESATVPAEEVKDPKRTIPRATYIGTAVTTLIYIVATVAVMGIIPLATLSGSNAPFADAATSIFGGTWGKWVALVGMISAFGALNGWTLLTARISLAASEDGLFPKVFGKVNGTRRTPIAGLVIAAVLVTGLVFMNYTKSLVDQFTFMLLLATLTTVVPYAFAAAAEIVLMIREPAKFAGRKMLRDAIVAMFGFGYAVWAMYATGSEAIAKGYILLMLGIPIFLYLRWRTQRDRIPIRTELIEVPEVPVAEAPPALREPASVT
ncbi:MAG TPA: amino acid permease [Actinomycetota bacterium]|nr:amino acid permease [Actinomycetota bacterium]